MAIVNDPGSTGSNYDSDLFEAPLRAGPSQPLIDAQNETSALAIPGTRSDPDTAPNPVPMYPYGFEGQADDLFSLNPQQKG